MGENDARTARNSAANVAREKTVRKLEPNQARLRAFLAWRNPLALRENFIPDWRHQLATSYTLLAFVSLALTILIPEIAWFGFERDTDPVIWGRLQLFIIFSGFFGRFVIQGDRGKYLRRVILFVILGGSVLAGSMAFAQTTERATMKILAPMVERWEGLENYAYLDRIASLPLWTICSGHTKGVKAGDYMTDAQCRALLKDELVEYRDGLHRSFTFTTKRRHLTPERDAAFVSLAYNAGIYAIGRSTAVRRLNAGNIAGACQALTWWNRAGGRRVRGLVNRRSYEYQKCMVGVA